MNFEERQYQTAKVSKMVINELLLHGYDASRVTVGVFTHEHHANQDGVDNIGFAMTIDGKHKAVRIPAREENVDEAFQILREWFNGE